MMSRTLAAGLALVLSGAAYAADLPEPVYPTGEAAAAADGSRGVGSEIFAACRRAIAEWAEPYGPVDIRMVSTGPVRRKLFGKRVAPLFVQIVYDTQGGRETRKAEVDCTVGANDSVAVQARP